MVVVVVLRFTIMLFAYVIFASAADVGSYVSPLLSSYIIHTHTYRVRSERISTYRSTKRRLIYRFPRMEEEYI